MDWQTRSGYVLLDSLLRSPWTDREIAAMKSVRGLDSIKEVPRYLYSMEDYDPLLFAEYGVHGQNLNPAYKRSPMDAVNLVKSICYSQFADSATTSYLVDASYILHVLVTAQHRDVDTLHGGDLPMVTADVIVLDTIKGRRFPVTACDSAPSPQGSTKGNEVSDRNQCLQICYSPAWSRKPGDRLGYHISHGEYSFDKTSLGWNALSPGHEYIVFLYAQYLDNNGMMSFYHLVPIMDDAGGIYSIDQGKLKDPNNLWHLGYHPTVSRFKANLRQQINEIVSAH